MPERAVKLVPNTKGPPAVPETLNLTTQSNAIRAAMLINAPALPGKLPDPGEQVFLRFRETYERMLADPGITPEARKSYEQLLQLQKSQLANHRTNAQLWENLVQAKQSKDDEKATRAERELADFLALRLGKIKGKTYPTNMSLEAVMKEYRAQPGVRSP